MRAVRVGGRLQAPRIAHVPIALYPAFDERKRVGQTVYHGRCQLKYLGGGPFEVGNANHAHARSMGGARASLAVIKHHALGWFGVRAFGGKQEDVELWLSVLYLRAVGKPIKQVEQPNVGKYGVCPVGGWLRLQGSALYRARPATAAPPVRRASPRPYQKAGET